MAEAKSVAAADGSAAGAAPKVTQDLSGDEEIESLNANNANAWAFRKEFLADNVKVSVDQLRDLYTTRAQHAQEQHDTERAQFNKQVAALDALVIQTIAGAKNADQLAVDRQWNVNATDANEAALAAAVARTLAGATPSGE